MKTFTTPATEAILHYFHLNNVALCDFSEGCIFLAEIFPSSFPPEKLHHGKVVGPSGKMYSNYNWRNRLKRKLESELGSEMILKYIIQNISEQHPELHHSFHFIFC
jgi:hypothetical protein